MTLRGDKEFVIPMTLDDKSIDAVIVAIPAAGVPEASVVEVGSHACEITTLKMRVILSK